MPEDIEGDVEAPEYLYAAVHDEWNENEMLEVLIAEGDDDAVSTAYEVAVLEVDDDLSPAYSSYGEARRKLTEKSRSRRFRAIQRLLPK